MDLFDQNCIPSGPISHQVLTEAQLCPRPLQFGFGATWPFSDNIPNGYWNFEYFMCKVNGCAQRFFDGLLKLLLQEVKLATAAKMLSFVPVLLLHQDLFY